MHMISSWTEILRYFFPVFDRNRKIEPRETVMLILNTVDECHCFNFNLNEHFIRPDRIVFKKEKKEPWTLRRM